MSDLGQAAPEPPPLSPELPARLLPPQAELPG
jgi:hypothetical protein